MVEKLINEGSLLMLQEFLASQRSAVLATTENGQPYLSLMAFAATDDLQYLLVATYRATRKFRNIEADPRVALLVDNRSNQPSDTEQSMAVTALGRAKEVEATERNWFLRTYIAKHPHLEIFVSSPECTLIKIRVERYFLVSNFQEIKEVVPRQEND
jgi:nitroimidazol reductase NimA-like FMN-containing flavoprotein (pyridoxamine 5'-phosphate oxidase superfamily)